MFIVRHFTKRLAVLTVLTFAAGASGTETVRAEDAIEKMQQTIDAADARIRQIVRELATPGLSTEAIARLNREMDNQQWVKGQAQLAIVKERDARRKQREREERIRVETAQLDKAAARYITEGKSLNTDLASHNSEVEQCEAAIRHFNAGTWNQAEYNRLNNWKKDLDDRTRRLNDRIRNHEAKRAELWDWWNRINRMSAQN